MKLTLKNKIRNRSLLPLSVAVLSMVFASSSVKAETTDSLNKISTTIVTVPTIKQSAISLDQPAEQIIYIDKVAEISQPVDIEDRSQTISNVPVDGKTVDEQVAHSQLVSEMSIPVNTLQPTQSVTKPTQKLSPQSQVSQVATLTATPLGSAKQLKEQPANLPSLIAQTNNNSSPLFRPTRSGPSYLGIGGNFGITGNSDLGGRSLAIISKVGLSDVWSIRPSVLFLSNFASFLVPVTYDFAPQQFLTPDLTIAPYLGGGVAITTGSNNTFGPLLTTGVDIPISRNFTVNIAANLAFIRTTDLGILVGIAYNFQ